MKLFFTGDISTRYGTKYLQDKETHVIPEERIAVLTGVVTGANILVSGLSIQLLPNPEFGLLKVADCAAENGILRLRIIHFCSCYHIYNIVK